MAYSDRFWNDIKTAFERGVSTKKLSKINGVSRAAISTRAEKEGWTRPAETFASVISAEIEDATARRIVGSAGHTVGGGFEEGVDVLAEHRMKVIDAHQTEWRKVDVLRAKAMGIAALVKVVKEDLCNDTKRGEISAKLGIAAKLMNLYRDAVDATSSKQEAERRAHGFDYKMQREAKRDERSGENVEEFMKLLDEMAERIATPTPEVPKRSTGETVQ